MANRSVPGTERAALRARLGAASRWGSPAEREQIRVALAVLGAVEALERVSGSITREQRARLAGAVAAIPARRRR